MTCEDEFSRKGFKFVKSRPQLIINEERRKKREKRVTEITQRIAKELTVKKLNMKYNNITSCHYPIFYGLQ